MASHESLKLLLLSVFWFWLYVTIHSSWELKFHTIKSFLLLSFFHRIRCDAHWFYGKMCMQIFPKIFKTCDVKYLLHHNTKYSWQRNNIQIDFLKPIDFTKFGHYVTWHNEMARKLLYVDFDWCHCILMLLLLFRAITC